MHNFSHTKKKPEYTHDFQSYRDVFQQTIFSFQTCYILCKKTPFLLK